MLEEEKNLKNSETEEPPIFCHICKESTKYNVLTRFLRFHFHVDHKEIKDKDYFDQFLKKENDGVCRVCSNETRFINMSFGYRWYCCPTCTQKDKNVREKIKNSTLERTGYEHNSLDPANWEKVRKTSLEKYGVESYFHTQQHKDKMSGPMDEEKKKKKVAKTKKTNIERYGVENTLLLDKVSLINKAVVLEQYLNILPEGYKIVKHNGHKHNHLFLCPQNHEFTSNYYTTRQRKSNNVEICTVCNPLYSNTISSFHEDVLSFIQKNYDKEIIKNDRKIIEPLELDIYLPELNLAFECNGIWFHNELHVKPYHHQWKSNLCDDKEVRLIHIYEDDWNIKRDIVESRILNILGKTKTTIFGRKCEVVKIPYNVSKEFLDNNHIQGNSMSAIRYGLFFEDELVSVMTFGSLRANLNQEREEGCFELLRFCNKLNTNVVGGAGKLFSHFIKNHEYKKVISYADRSWSNGGLYKKLGFEFVKKTVKNYWYVINDKRENRFNFRKDVLVSQGFNPNKSEREIMLEREIYRIYDSGSLLFEYMKK